ncbi:hypothetical protein [Labedaea rhizosphaerae]|uniref:Uncharacterized protein n=1 Tax=Labedaea rhizosphaerae TaxID=598644 RepID=A0A4V3CZQ8_LABRH|nr:hypothetical protein [Labedaea rhizosphaerae]TDQ00641.1 hypothetical protein EV186_102502 [Labedaea rhizosphaerae]
MTTPSAGAYIKVPAGCEITYRFDVDGDIEILLGSVHDGFELLFEPAALARFTAVAEQALKANVDHGCEQTSTFTPAVVV